MKKVWIFIICLSAALAVDFLREGAFSWVYAQFVVIDPAAEKVKTPANKGSYPAPDSSIKSKPPESVSGKPYPAPQSRPAEK